jgi:sulfur carrier protein
MFGAALCQTSAFQSTLNRDARVCARCAALLFRGAMEIGLGITVSVNGEQRRVPAGLSVAAMLSELGIDPKRVAVERNLEIVARALLGEVTVEHGDAFEIVHFVGGG